MGSTRSGDRQKLSQSGSRAMASQSYFPNDQEGTQENLSDGSFPEGGTAIEEDYSQSVEEAKEPANNARSDVSMDDSVDRQNDPFTDVDQVKYDMLTGDAGEQTNPSFTSLRKAHSCRCKNGQEHLATNSSTSRQSGRPRSASPRKGGQRTTDQRLHSPGGRRIREAEDIERAMARGLSSDLSVKRGQPPVAAARAREQSNGAREHQPNGGGSDRHYRNDNTRELSARNRTKNNTHQAPSKHGSESVSSVRNEKHKEASVAEDKLLDPTTVRLNGVAAKYIQCIRQTGNWEGYFLGFANELINEIKQSEDRVNSLSEEMLAGRDRYQPITDGEFQDLMSSLRGSVKALAKDISGAARKVKLQGKEFRDILEGRTLTRRIDDDAWKDEKRIYLIQSAIWKVLKDHLFYTPFQVFGNEGLELGTTWKLLFSEARIQDRGEDSRPPRQTELSEKWKSLSATRLEEKYRDQPGAGCEIAARVVVENLAHPLSANTLEYSPESGWGQRLNMMLLCAAKLATGVAKQRSRLELYVPDIAALQKGRSLHGNVHVLGKIVDIEDEQSFNGDFAFVVIPGLRRWGDGLGTNLNRHADLEPAQVRCIEYEVD